MNPKRSNEARGRPAQGACLLGFGLVLMPESLVLLQEAREQKRIYLGPCPGPALWYSKRNQEPEGGSQLGQGPVRDILRASRARKLPSCFGGRYRGTLSRAPCPLCPASCHMPSSAAFPEPCYSSSLSFLSLSCGLPYLYTACPPRPQPPDSSDRVQQRACKTHSLHPHTRMAHNCQALSDPSTDTRLPDSKGQCQDSTWSPG